jgi:hypothetical protein
MQIRQQSRLRARTSKSDRHRGRERSCPLTGAKRTFPDVRHSSDLDGSACRGHSQAGAGSLLHPHRLPGRDRALDGVSRFQVEHRLLRRGMHTRPASREEVEPSARFVPERAPEIADRPVAGRVAAEKRQIDGMAGHIRTRLAISALQALHRVSSVLPSH